MNRVLKLVACAALFLLTFAAHAQESHGIAVANIDTTVKPGDNFYLYANGNWIKRTEIPADRGSIGVFSALADLSNKRTADIIEESA
ncbi:MAG: M13 family peptidase, partial [Alloacidobacterium sp.]